MNIRQGDIVIGFDDIEYLVFDTMLTETFSCIDYKTNSKVEHLTQNDIKEVIKMPSNISSFFIKRCEIIAKKWHTEMKV